MIKVTRGLPGSGKSTWAEQWVAEDPTTRARVCRDDVRMELFGAYWGPQVDEEAVTAVMDAQVAALVKLGRDVVVDATHLSAEAAKHWFAFGEVEFVDFPEPVEEVMERDAARKRQTHFGRGVGRDVIAAMAKRYHIKADGRLPKQPQPAAHDRYLFKLYEPTGDMTPTFIFDIDGTLANGSARDPFDFDKAGDDTLHVHIAYLMRELARNHSIVVVTGRMETRRKQLTDWLERHGLDIWVDDIFMRREGDKRRDDLIKHELFWEHVAPNYDVLGVFDDRDRVVDAWRAMGIPCYQVARGNF